MSQPGGRRLTLMTVHAHPDDEATSTGGVLARYADEGVRTILVTCTDGACGDGPGGVKPGQPGHDPAAVAEMRRHELERSCAVLGVDVLELLEYGDSGMMGWPQNDAPHSFWRTPVDAAADRLVELIRRYEPDVVVTYDENGFYGHPDHIQAHRVTMAAVDRLAAGDDPAAGPAKVYWTTAPQSRMAEFRATVEELGGNWDDPDDEPGPDIGLPDDEITTWVDARDVGGRKFDALLEHGSQGDNIFFIQLGRDKFIDLMGTETFVRVRDRTGAPVPEDDLFAGLR